MNKKTKNIKFHILHSPGIRDIKIDVQRKICLFLDKNNDFRAMTSSELFCKTCPIGTECAEANRGHDGSVEVNNDQKNIHLKES